MATQLPNLGATFLSLFVHIQSSPTHVKRIRMRRGPFIGRNLVLLRVEELNNRGEE